jgi:FixJ family two-component response regulator
MNDVAVSKVVIVVDPDGQSREQTVQQLQQSGLPARAYATCDQFFADLATLRRATYSCVVSELRFPSGSGLTIMDALKRERHVSPVVFYTAGASIRDAVHVMREGAVALVDKADGPGALLPYIEEGLERSRREYDRWHRCHAAAEQLERMSEGEQQVLRGIMAGMLNKEIAQELNLSIRTIEQRRREIFRKLGVQHPASLASKVTELMIFRQTSEGSSVAQTARWIHDIRVDGPVQLHQAPRHHNGDRASRGDRLHRDR